MITDIRLIWSLQVAGQLPGSVRREAGEESVPWGVVGAAELCTNGFP